MIQHLDKFCPLISVASCNYLRNDPFPADHQRNENRFPGVGTGGSSAKPLTACNYLLDYELAKLFISLHTSISYRY